MFKAKGSFVIKFILFLTLAHCNGQLDDTVTVTNALDGKENTIPDPTLAVGNGRQYPSFGGCPLCDASVYSYCSYKVIHDSCCCDFPVMQLKPPQCLYYDCSLIYAKSCYEHGLIKNCCCNSPY